MTIEQFLNWLADRIVNQYGESENVDFIIRLRRIARIQSSLESDIIKYRSMISNIKDILK